MRINPVQQYSNQRSTNFKGTVSPEVAPLIQKWAKREAKKYVLSLEKGVKADEKVLFDIKKSWNAILDELNKKTSQMHSDTLLCVNPVNIDLPYPQFDYFRNDCLTFINKNLNIWSTSLAIAKEEFNHNGPSYKIAETFVNGVEPKKNDKVFLDGAISKFEKELEEDPLATSSKYSAIIEYQSQLENVSKEEAEQNIARLNKALENRDEKWRIEAIEKENLALLDELFGADK